MGAGLRGGAIFWRRSHFHAHHVLVDELFYFLIIFFIQGRIQEGSERVPERERRE
jgi:hypothetical protein